MEDVNDMEVSPDALQLLRVTTFDEGRCIICQKHSKERLVSTDNGRKRILEASEIRKDVVYKRIKLLKGESHIQYHCNNSCYKSYTMTKSLKKIAEKKDESEENEMMSEEKDSETLLLANSCPKRRSMSVARPPPRQENSDDINCVICGLARKNKERKKYRVSTSDRANLFLAATSYFKDDVFDRIADLNTETHVFAADLYSHPNCMRTYLRKYESSLSEHEPHEASGKYLLFLKANEVIAPLLELGYGFTLTDIRELMMKQDRRVQVYNNEIKIFLVRTYKDRIRFCQSEKKNEPLMVFSCNLTTEQLVTRMRSQENIKSVALLLRAALNDVDFKLKDKFCDASEIKESWETTKMPDVLVTFFSYLFNVSKTRLLQPKCDLDEFSSGDDDQYNDDVENEEEATRDRMSVQLFCLFQIMYYELHRGQVKTPLHMATGHAIYDKCKSKELITAMNKIGTSSSYPEVLRSRNLLSAYAIESSRVSNTPFPSHFTKDGFTTGAFDNFDFQDHSSVSGTCSTHDTALVLFQDSTGVAPGKSSVSDTEVHKHKLISLLPCQEVKSRHKPINKPTLLENFTVLEDEEIISELYSSNTPNSDFLISLIRCGIVDKEGTEWRKVPTWAGIQSLISRESVPLSRVAFLPVIPSPVTDYATVYTALKNFQNVRGQLNNQPVLPVFCDEGVFHNVADIVLSSPEEFRDIFPMMGAFHMTKIGLKCAGKYLSGSGMDDALVEAEIFGTQVVHSVMNGSHYMRSFQGMLIISEAIHSLQWEAFWAQSDALNCDELKDDLRNIRDLLIKKNEYLCQEACNDVKGKIGHLKEMFEKFIRECCEKSELCRYWQIFLDIFLPVKNLILADRTGNWTMHVQSVNALLPIFRAFDCINYLRYGSWYAEKINKLENDHPDLYEKFMQGYFVIKEKNNKFSSVAPDMKLEQTIQKAQKSSKGIVGHTRKSAYVAKWELVYHEVLMICNTFRSLISLDGIDQREASHHHDLVGKKSEHFNESVSRLLYFMQQQENPYKVNEPVRLHNFVTKQYVDILVKDRLLNVIQCGKEGYRKLREEIFVSKHKKLSDVISRIKLPRFDAKIGSHTKGTPLQKTNKQLSQAYKDMEIAKERGESTAKILEHDLLPTSKLFEGELPTKPSKHLLVAEIEKELPPEEIKFEKDSSLKTTVIVDFMSQIRMTKISSTKTFGELFHAVIERSLSVCSLQELHIIFDSYISRSLKECERVRRESVSGTIDLALIESSTPIPVQLQKFWSSTSNKTKLQNLGRKLLEMKSGEESVPIIASGRIIDDGTEQAVFISKEGKYVIENLNVRVEEADLRIIPHVDWSVKRGSKRIVVLSNDTDVVVLLLRYTGQWIKEGMNQLWIRYGIGKHRRFIPVHELYKALGSEMSKILIKAHILTGNDEISKIGTKAAALKADPKKYLFEFGESPLYESDNKKVEKYLVQVMKPSSKCDTFDELRLSEYRRGISICDLPPTSHSISGHILRAFYIIRQNLCLLDTTPPQNDPCNFGWEIIDELVRPKKYLNYLPSELLTLCSCKVCSNNRCRCRKAFTQCTHFCKCSGNECKNH